MSHHDELQPTPSLLHRITRFGLRTSLGIGLVAVVAVAACATAVTVADSRASTTQTASAAPGGARPVYKDGGPPPQATMTCDIQTQVSVGSALALRALPEPEPQWSNGMFICTYDLDGGPLVLTVKVLADETSAARYFDGLRTHLGTSEPIEGLASLGLPGYSTASGIVIFAKDNMTLEVDASAMTSRLGPNLISPAAFAYQIATNVLACWEAHP